MKNQRTWSDNRREKKERKVSTKSFWTEGKFSFFVINLKVFLSSLFKVCLLTLKVSSRVPAVNLDKYRLQAIRLVTRNSPCSTVGRRLVSDRREVCLPWIHPAINNRIIHWVTHRQPVDAEVNLLNVRWRRYLGIIRRQEKVNVLRRPADCENHNYDHHHKHNLKRNARSFRIDVKVYFNFVSSFPKENKLKVTTSDKNFHLSNQSSSSEKTN